MNNNDTESIESIQIKKPFYNDVKNQRIAVLLILLITFFGLFYTTQRDQFISLSEAENNEILMMEDQGFSYAYGTEPSDLGNDLNEFVPATPEQLTRLVEAVEEDDELINDEGQDLFELLEYDEWNNDGLMSTDVVNGLIQSAESQ